MLSSALLMTLAVPSAQAEGSQTIDGMALAQDTLLYVDILDSSTETIEVTVTGAVNVYAPDGSSMGTYSTGGVIQPAAGGEGAYAIVLSADQPGRWDFRVVDGAGLTAQGGRLHARTWHSNPGSATEDDAIDASFYALLPAGKNHSTVVEIDIQGLASGEWWLAANGTGVDGRSAGCSVPDDVHDFAEDYPLYLQPPKDASFSFAEAQADDLVFEAGDTACDIVSPDHISGYFRFHSATTGTWHIGCDIDKDGVIDITSDSDLALSGPAEVGLNEVEWDGTTSHGEPVPEGSYACLVRVATGEVHAIATDMATAWPGLRQFTVNHTGSRTQRVMYWNDTAVQGDAVTLPDGQTSLETTTQTGVASDTWGTDTVANHNAHAWGDFSGRGKGAQALMDTWSWSDSDLSNSIHLRVMDAATDTDGDGISDVDEECLDARDLGAGYLQGGCSAAPGRGPWWLSLLPLLAIRRRRR